MEKNWLIRTKNNHILGPVSKGKVRELVDNGSIKGEDEICSGNGFWFYVRETDMVEKYLKSEEKQPFNPVSEASTVVASGGQEGAPAREESDDITKVGLSLDDLKGELAEGSGEKKK